MGSDGALPGVIHHWFDGPVAHNPNDMPRALRPGAGKFAGLPARPDGSGS